MMVAHTCSQMNTEEEYMAMSVHMGTMSCCHASVVWPHMFTHELYCSTVQWAHIRHITEPCHRGIYTHTWAGPHCYALEACICLCTHEMCHISMLCSIGVHDHIWTMLNHHAGWYGHTWPYLRCVTWPCCTALICLITCDLCLCFSIKLWYSIATNVPV